MHSQNPVKFLELRSTGVRDWHRQQDLEIAVQDDAAQGAAAQGNGIDSFPPAETLSQWITSHDDTTDLHGRVLLLEDLSWSWVEAIYKGLGVPLSFFARHWASPTFYNRGETQPPLGQNPQNHFILSYSQLHDTKIQTIGGEVKPEYYRLEGFVYRTISFGQDEPGGEMPDDPNGGGAKDWWGRKAEKNSASAPQPAASQQLVSYWAVEDGGGPWTG